MLNETAAPAQLHESILAWYQLNARDLPWRAADRTPWQVLVSEVMLQQTPVARVLPVWQEWLSRWPTPTHLANSTTGAAVRAWGRLGYPRRALRLHAAAQQMVARHDGQVPREQDQLRALDGVGEYTAAAVASFAFGQRHAVVDTNVRRVLARSVQGQARPGKSLTAVERQLAQLLVPQLPAQAAQWAVAVMELGALVCTARAPKCAACPVLSHCAWQLAGAPESTEPPPRGQSWQGTDRQVRGRILALLRAEVRAFSHSELLVAIPADELSDTLQRDRCLGTLLEDGLVEQVPLGYQLPE